MQIIWMECRLEHFEFREYALVIMLLGAVFEDAIRQGRKPLVKGNGNLTILHLFPPAMSFKSVPEWVQETSSLSRHISVNRMDGNHSPRPLAISWAEQASDLWILGTGKNLKKILPVSRFTESEMQVINHMKPYQLWVRSGESGESIVINVGQTTELPGWVNQLRHKESRYRKLSQVRQMSAAADSLICSSTGEADLYKKLCRTETLRLGWLRVQTGSKKSAGIDGVSTTQFQSDLERQLSQLAAELSNKRYRCKTLRRVYIQKMDGGKRALGIGCVRDKVVQTACLMLLEPIFEPVFSSRSFAFRPGRNAHQALAMARSIISEGRNWIVIADIKKCFESIDHDVLLGQVAKRVSDHDLLNLLHHWLTVAVFDFHDLLPIVSGVPQGQSLSPLLANIYLDPLDKRLEECGFPFVRYADDIIIPATGRDEAQNALEIMEQVLREPMHLELKPAKTQFVSFEEGFEFLGFRIDPLCAKIQQTRVDRIENLLQPKIKELGLSDATLAKRAEALMQINAMIRGFRNYFRLPDEPQINLQLSFLDSRIEDMAGFLLPAGIRNDPAWICRERFFIEPIEGTADLNLPADIVAQAGLTYPEDRTNLLPSEWMLKDHAPQSVTHMASTGPKETFIPVSLTRDGKDDEAESVVKVNNGANFKSWTKQVTWRSKETTPGDILNTQTDSLKKLFLREDAYHPFRMRW